MLFIMCHHARSRPMHAICGVLSSSLLDASLYFNGARILLLEVGGCRDLTGAQFGMFKARVPPSFFRGFLAESQYFITWLWQTTLR